MSKDRLFPIMHVPTFNCIVMRNHLYRQQSHHFGLSNNTVQKFDGATNNRKRSIFTSTETVITEVDTKQTDYTVSDVTEPFDEILTELPNADSITTAPYDYLEQDVESDIWEVPIMLPNIDHHKQESQQLSPMYDDRPATVNNVIHRVSVLLHNITLISEDTSKHPDNQVESLIERYIYHVYLQFLYLQKGYLQFLS